MNKNTVLILYLVLILFFFVNIYAALSGQPQESLGKTPSHIISIPVSGEVNPPMAMFISRAIQDVSSYPDPVIIFIMDTFGGRVDAALRICDTILNIPDSIQTIAFVKNKAISAGALIALSCNKLFMKENTTIGDCAPIAVSGEGPKMLGEKFQSPLRAKFRAIAQKNGFPVRLAQAMVSTGSEIYRITTPDSVFYLDSTGLAELDSKLRKKILDRKTVVKKGELLTMSDREAVEFGFSEASVKNLGGLIKKIAGGKTETIDITKTWSETLVNLIGKIAPLLMMLGFAGVYTELKSPGFGWPGIIGVFCLALVFGSQYLTGLANYTEILLVITGVMLLAAELFVIPGFGIAGISGIIVLSIGMILSLQGFTIPEPSMPWQKDLLQRNIVIVLGSMIGSVIIFMGFFRFVAPGITRFIPGPYLTGDLSGSNINPEISLGLKPGDTGIVTKPLRPSGTVKFGNNNYQEVVSDGDFVDKETTVKITDIQANRIYVIRSDTDEQ